MEFYGYQALKTKSRRQIDRLIDSLLPNPCPTS
jgi:hypothetical protein